MHTAFYLKYRPQSLADLIGQEQVKKNLLNAFAGNKLSHAYLFVGPRGTGKTSTARILAKMVNCEHSVILENENVPADIREATPESKRQDAGQASMTDNIPCNQCTTCISITDGSNMDLIEIDAASNRGIEDIRLLREKIKLSPSASKKKVYIIDEVHMLTTEAFNALLKTLEEPPAHALFILATTDVSKLPATILSRVQRLDFKLATVEELSESLKKIIKAEKIDIEDEALKMLVKRAEGSFRDGVKLLEQISGGKEKITARVLQESFNASGFDKLLNLLQSLAKKDATQSLLNIAEQTEYGVDIRELTLNLMDAFRNLVLIKNDLGEQLVKKNLTEEKYNQLIAVAQNFTIAGLTHNLDILQNSLEKLKTASIQSLPLELAVVEICAGSSKLKDQSEKLEEKEIIIEQKEVEMDKSAVNPTLTNGGSSDLSKIKEKWTFVLETIRPYNFSLEALLRSTTIKECTDVKVVMEVPYSFHQRILEAPKNRDLLESILSDILGRNIQVATTLGNRPQRKEDIVNIEVAADDEIIRAAAEIFNSDTIN